MKIAFRAAILAATCWSASALAGDTVLYEATPKWVDAAELSVSEDGTAIRIFDQQVWLEEGRVNQYFDLAVRIDNPQALNSFGTIQAEWQPDKGDLMVHRVQILRDGQAIDVLGGGAQFEILRRETQLENRTLDGSLTATLAVPGLRVGDTLRVSYTTTKSDQALGPQVQTYLPMLQEPVEMTFGRAMVSWPDTLDVRWKAAGADGAARTFSKNGREGVSVLLPLPEKVDMPADAPKRYSMDPLMQAGTFEGWREVSSVMAPHYKTRGTIAPGSSLAGIVDGIRQSSNDPMQQAVAALQVVQDDVSYLMNGLDGGNYIPQTPADTWDKRYGDCKAKTLLLLAMLHELGIDAEPVMVSMEMGDAVPTMLPMPGAFDHVIVRATIDGESYWLDGTGSGASMASVGYVPSFSYGLPIADGGADLITMDNRVRSEPDTVLRMTVDHRAGLDVPALVDVEFVMSGQIAGEARAIMDMPEGAKKDELFQSLGEAAISNFTLLDHSMDFSPDGSRVTLRLNGIASSPWEWERGRAKRSLSLTTTDFSFRPNRAKSTWRDIPVVVSGPSYVLSEMTMLLPEAQGNWTFDGKQAFDTTLATVHLQRETTVEGNRVFISDSAQYPGGEIAVEDVSAYRSEAARFGSFKLTMRAPESLTPVSHLLAPDRQRYQAIDGAFADALERDPDNTTLLARRGYFHYSIGDYDQSLEYYSRNVDIDGEAVDFENRAAVLYQMGRLDDALVDAEMVFDLDPTTDALIYRTDIMALLGMDEAALELLQDWDGGSDSDLYRLGVNIADLEAKLGRPAEGLARLDELGVLRPGDPELLNTRCWYLARWNHALDQIEETCVEAVEKSQYSASVLDSRALGWFRLGDYDKALADYDAVLTLSPDSHGSRYMRGITRLKMGDKGGRQDIDLALRARPMLAREYAVWGFKPD